VLGVGFVLGWLRPLLPPELMIWAHIGNLIQVLGFAMDLAVYCQFLGVKTWLKPLKTITTWVLLVFVVIVVWPESRHPMII